MKNKAVVIFSGYNQRAVIAFLRVLKKNKIPFGIIAKSKEDTIFLSEYKYNVLYIRKHSKLVLDDLLIALREVKNKLKANEIIIAPSTEALNRFILKHKKKFNEINCTIPLVDEYLYNKISDKLTFSELCKDNGIKIPEEIDINKNTLFPFVAKPKFYFSKKTNTTLAPVIIENEKEKEEFILNYDLNDFYYQKYIGGESKYLLYYFHRDGSIFKFSQKNLIQQPNGKSMVAAISSNFHLSDESKKYETLFKKIKFFGFVMVEVKGDENYMIEANPRFWGPSQLFVDSKVNLFEAFLHDYGLIYKKPAFDFNNYIYTPYFWYGGIFITLQNKGKFKYHNYNADKFIRDFPIFIKNDIYRREDTYNIFKKELGL